MSHTSLRSVLYLVSPTPFEPQFTNPPPSFKPQFTNPPPPLEPQSTNLPPPLEPQSTNPSTQLEPPSANPPSPLEPPSTNPPHHPAARILWLLPHRVLTNRQNDRGESAPSLDEPRRRFRPSENDDHIRMVVTDESRVNAIEHPTLGPTGYERL